MERKSDREQNGIQKQIMVLRRRRCTASFDESDTMAFTRPEDTWADLGPPYSLARSRGSENGIIHLVPVKLLGVGFPELLRPDSEDPGSGHPPIPKGGGQREDGITVQVKRGVDDFELNFSG